MDSGTAAFLSGDVMSPERFPATTGIRGTIEFLGVDVTILGARFNPAGSFALVTPIPKLYRRESPSLSVRDLDVDLELRRRP